MGSFLPDPFDRLLKYLKVDRLLMTLVKSNTKRKQEPNQRNEIREHSALENEQ